MSNKNKGKVDTTIHEEGGIKYRNFYSKSWNDEKPFINCILFNPSKADLEVSDRTLNRLSNEFKDSYGGIKILNLFSVMETNLTDDTNYNEEKEKNNLEYILKYIENNKESHFFIGWSNSFKYYPEKYEIEAKVRKKMIEKLFRSLNLKNNVFCYRNKNRKALHPSRYRSYWTYDKYFKR
jgi:hypothetical protein